MLPPNWMKEFELVDLSHTLSNQMPMTVPYGHVTWLDMNKGDFAHAKCLFLGEHHGTHVDAPGHLVKDGANMWIEQLPLEAFFGPCCVIDATSKGENGEFSAADIEDWEAEHGRLGDGDIVLFNFGWDAYWQVPSPAQHYTVGRSSYYRNWPGLVKDAAVLLQDRRVKLVGTDAPSIDAYPFAGGEDPEPCHPILQLGEIPIIICEGLERLSFLPSRGAVFFGLPIKIMGGTGAPIRGVAFIPRRA